MTGTLARQAGRGASASPRNEASRAPRMPAKYPPPPSTASYGGGAARAATSSCRRPHRMPRSLTQDLVDPGRGRDAFQDHRAREDHVRAAWIEADHPLALRLGRPAQARDFTAEIGARQAVAVNARRVVAGEVERHRRQRGDGARDADQGRRLARERDALDGRVDRAGDRRLLVVRGRIVMNQRLRQPNGSERQAGSKPNLPVGGEHDLGRAAADVDDDELVRRGHPGTPRRPRQTSAPPRAGRRSPGPGCPGSRRPGPGTRPR